MRCRHFWSQNLKNADKTNQIKLRIETQGPKPLTP
uniref:Uncharacterized protein n=1 Tax=Rhizophora mucronata TaxID=61149 RepID=A0A2P2M9U4_RHIMU